MNPLYDEFFAIAKRCSYGENSFNDDRFPALGTDSLHYDDFQTADRWVAKWPPAVQNGSPLILGRIPHYTGTGKWPPYGGSSLHDEVFRPLEHIETVFNVFQWFLKFCLTTISLNSDLNGTDRRHQAKHHCTPLLLPQQ